MKLVLTAAAFLLALALPRGPLEAQIAEPGWNDSYRENIDEDHFGLGRRDSLTGEHQAPPRRARRAPRGHWDQRRGSFIRSPRRPGPPVWIWVQVEPYQIR